MNASTLVEFIYLVYLVLEQNELSAPSEQHINQLINQYYLMGFDIDRIGCFAPSPKCKHGKDSDFIVLCLKHMKIPFRNKALDFFFRPITDFFCITHQDDTYSHDCIFADIRCKVCGRQTVFTMEYQQKGTVIRRGYYREGGITHQQLNIPKKWEVSWQDIAQIFYQNEESGSSYRLNGNNCQDWVNQVYPQMVSYARSCR